MEATGSCSGLAGGLLEAAGQASRLDPPYIRRGNWLPGGAHTTNVLLVVVGSAFWQQYRSGCRKGFDLESKSKPF